MGAVTAGNWFHWDTETRSHSPQRQRSPLILRRPDTGVYGGRIFARAQPRPDRVGDGVTASGRAPHISQRRAQVSAPAHVLDPVGRVRAQPHVRRIRAGRVVALVAHGEVVGRRPPGPCDDTVCELVREQVRRHGAATLLSDGRRPENREEPLNRTVQYSTCCPETAGRSPQTGSGYVM